MSYTDQYNQNTGETESWPEGLPELSDAQIRQTFSKMVWQKFTKKGEAETSHSGWIYYRADLSGIIETLKQDYRNRIRCHLADYVGPGSPLSDHLNDELVAFGQPNPAYNACMVRLREIFSKFINNLADMHGLASQYPELSGKLSTGGFYLLETGKPGVPIIEISEYGLQALGFTIDPEKGTAMAPVNSDLSNYGPQQPKMATAETLDYN